MKLNHVLFWSCAARLLVSAALLLPIVRSDQSLSDVTRLLAARNPAVLVREDDHFVGILTRFDMLQFIAGSE